MTAVERILILRLSALGDIVHTLPAVEMLRLGFPQARIVWVVERPYEQLVRASAAVDDVITVSTRAWRKAPFASATLASIRAVRRRLRSEGSGGLAIDFQGLAKSAVLGRLSGRAEQLTFPSHLVRERIARWMATMDAEIDAAQHVVDQNRALARAAGGKGDGSFTGLQRFAALAADVPGDLLDRVILNPGAGRADKMWPLPRWSEIGRRLNERGVRSLVVWGPGEEHLADAIAGTGAVDKAPPTTLPQLAYVLSRSRLVVAGDTGPLHIAAGLGVPVIALFGPTSSRRNGPWGQLEQCVEGGGSMDGISVDEVAGRLKNTLTEVREANRAK